MVNSSGISSGGALCVELWLKQVFNRMLVPMFDITVNHLNSDNTNFAGHFKKAPRRNITFRNYEFRRLVFFRLAPRQI